MDIWAAGCIFTELLTRKAFLQVKKILKFLNGIHSISFKTKSLYAEKLMSMAVNCSLMNDDALSTLLIQKPS